MCNIPRKKLLRFLSYHRNIQIVVLFGLVVLPPVANLEEQMILTFEERESCTQMDLYKLTQHRYLSSKRMTWLKSRACCALRNMTLHILNPAEEVGNNELAEALKTTSKFHVGKGPFWSSGFVENSIEVRNNYTWQPKDKESQYFEKRFSTSPSMCLAIHHQEDDLDFVGVSIKSCGEERYFVCQDTEVNHLQSKNTKVNNLNIQKSTRTFSSSMFSNMDKQDLNRSRNKRQTFRGVLSSTGRGLPLIAAPAKSRDQGLFKNNLKVDSSINNGGLQTMTTGGSVMLGSLTQSGSRAIEAAVSSGTEGIGALAARGSDAKQTLAATGSGAVDALSTTGTGALETMASRGAGTVELTAGTTTGTTDIKVATETDTLETLAATGAGAARALASTGAGALENATATGSRTVETLATNGASSFETVAANGAGAVEAFSTTGTGALEAMASRGAGTVELTSGTTTGTTEIKVATGSDALEGLAATGASALENATATGSNTAETLAGNGASAFETVSASGNSALERTVIAGTDTVQTVASTGSGKVDLQAGTATVETSDSNGAGAIETMAAPGTGALETMAGTPLQPLSELNKGSQSLLASTELESKSPSSTDISETSSTSFTFSTVSDNSSTGASIEEDTRSQSVKQSGRFFTGFSSAFRKGIDAAVNNSGFTFPQQGSSDMTPGLSSSKDSSVSNAAVVNTNMGTSVSSYKAATSPVPTRPPTAPASPPKQPGLLNLNLGPTSSENNPALINLDLTEPPPPPDLPKQTFFNVSYGTDPNQIMDIYLPAGRNTLISKVILVIHGTAWVLGKKELMTNWVVLFLRDFPQHVVVNMNYRLATIQSLAFPKQIEDISAVISYLKSKAKEYFFKPKFALMGSSAGAHLAMLYGYGFDKNKDVQVICNHIGHTNISDSIYTKNRTYDNLFRALVGNVAYETNKTVYEIVSPVTYIRKDSPKTISFFGAIDPIVPYSQAVMLDDALDTAGVINKMYVYSGGHGNFNLAEIAQMWKKINYFFKNYL